LKDCSHLRLWDDRRQRFGYSYVSENWNFISCLLGTGDGSHVSTPHTSSGGEYGMTSRWGLAGYNTENLTAASYGCRGTFHVCQNTFITPLSTMFQLYTDCLLTCEGNGSNHGKRYATCQWQTLSHRFVSSTPHHGHESNPLLECW
jgi:hypothetical protein